ncbi:39S ribosomal protein L16, mitochondrial [Sorochytrium milnesiophthora]
MNALCGALRSLTLALAPARPAVQSLTAQRRFAGEIVHPRKVRFRKAHKGRVSIPTGGSQSGTRLVYGTYGLQLRDGARLSAQQLEAARKVIRRKIRAVKDAKMWLRVFPDIPVTSKGNETRMGKGKGTFEYYACRVPMDRIVFEIGGPGLKWEVAKDALRQGGMKLPVACKIVRKEQSAQAVEDVVISVPTPAASPVPASL